MRSEVKFASVLALVLSLGLHWGVLQTIAWTGMIVKYSHATSLAEAVNQTFDGQHACQLCKIVKQGRAGEKQDGQKQQVKPGSQLDAGIIWQAPVFEFIQTAIRIPSPHTTAVGRLDDPPLPPPRAA